MLKFNNFKLQHQKHQQQNVKICYKTLKFVKILHRQLKIDIARLIHKLCVQCMVFTVSAIKDKQQNLPRAQKIKVCYLQCEWTPQEGYENISSKILGSLGNSTKKYYRQAKIIQCML